MFSVNIDISGLDSLKELSAALKEATSSAANDLAAMTHAKMVELAGERLHARRQMFVDALHVKEEDGVLLVELDASAGWIDDGLDPHDMLENLLKSPKAQRSKDGSMYMVVPFEHGPGKGPTNSPESTADLVSTVKAEMKRRKIPWGKIEKDENGKPKLGKLHRFNVGDAPLKTGGGPGQGWGPVGDVKQGYSEKNARMKEHGGPGGGGIPFLRGVAVYQKAVDGGKTKRSVMTFRIASSKHQGQGRWHHPGLDAVNIFEDGYKWAQEQVENTIIPGIIAKLVDL